MPPRIFFEKPIDKIRPLCYTFAKEAQVLLFLIKFCKASMKRMNEEKLNQMAEFIHHYVRENNGESPKFKDMHRDTITNPKFYDPEIRAYDDPDEQMILRA